MAMEVPVTIIDMAVAPCSSRTTRTANGLAMDQNTACAQATMRRAQTSRTNVDARAEHSWPTAKTVTTTTMRRRGGTRLPSSMSGKDSTATAQA